jgi:DNA invertase Pin-like site-specific DNA recombinase
MNPKITPDHLRRAAVVYVRQSTMAQVTGNLESQRRQYDLAKAAEAAGFASVTVDDDLGRSGSGTMQRPGFERLVAMVCSGDVGAVYCIEASRLARNGRDWHHLIDLCALAGALVVDPDGAYDPRIVNDRLLLGLKGTMSEYELSLMRQRGIAARDSKAKRGEFRFMLRRPRPAHRVDALLVQEIVCELDDATNEAVLLIHWTGGRHTEVRVPRVKTGRYPSDIANCCRSYPQTCRTLAGP